MKRDVVSCRRFEWLLKQRNLGFEPEQFIFRRVPDRGKRPDYYVMPADPPHFLAEVESFEKPTVLNEATESTGHLNPMSLQKRINRAVRNAAEQLEPYADLGIPLVVILDNHRQVGLALGHHELVSLFGQLWFTFGIDVATGARIEDPSLEHQDDGSPFACGARNYVSAVVVNIPNERLVEDDFTVERPMKVLVIHHPRAIVHLPASVFRDQCDVHIVYRAGRWPEVRGDEYRD